MRATIEALTEFIWAERDRFASRENNMFAFGFSKISKTVGYLAIILGRYDEVSAEFLENTQRFLDDRRQGTHELTTEEHELLRASEEITSRLHLEIESFYLFAKILLDQVAHAVEFYFGKARGLSLDSHDDLTKCIRDYAEGKGLSALDGDLIELIESLKSDISDYRDYEIAHEKSPRTMKATIFDMGERPGTRIINTKVYPTERDIQRESKTLHELAEHLDEYIRRMLDWIRGNRQRCCLPGSERQGEAQRS